MRKRSEKELAILEQFRPKRLMAKKDSLTNYVPKEDIFTKEKSYIDKGKAMTIQADWLKIRPKGVSVVLVMGERLYQSELNALTPEAIELYLEKIEDEKPAKKATKKEIQQDSPLADVEN